MWILLNKKYGSTYEKSPVGGRFRAKEQERAAQWGTWAVWEQRLCD